MGARVCLRSAVIADTVSSWNMYEIFVAGREATKKTHKNPINQSINESCNTYIKTINFQYW